MKRSGPMEGLGSAIRRGLDTGMRGRYRKQ
jgi:hypothetical protein